MKEFDKILFLRSINDSDTIKYLNNKYGNKRILIEIDNTKGLSSCLFEKLNDNFYIRVKGGYDQNRIDAYEGVSFSDGSNSDYLYDSVIYSRNELINILRQIEKIEKGIKEDYTDLEKVVYIYNYLKKDIMYDPKYETEPSSKTRSLRGLILKQSVCAGYSTIFKELLDRQGIKCEYVEGFVGRDKSNDELHRVHAWNIVSINNKKYGFDLTWENSQYRKGNFYTYYYLGTNKDIFSLRHVPFEFEETQNYEDTLSEFNKDLICDIYGNILINEEHSKNLYILNRFNSKPCTICHLGNVIGDDGKVYHRYLFFDGLPDNYTHQQILYSEINMTGIIYSKLHGKKYSKDKQNAIVNSLFSNDNINDSNKRNTNYIGSPFDNEEKVFDKIIKDEDAISSLDIKSYCLKRSDGSCFIIEEDNQRDNNGLFCYNMYELLLENNEYVVKSNCIYSDVDFIKDKRGCITDKLLSRKHIDQMCTYYRGYIGYCDKNDNIILTKDLVFNIEKNNEFFQKQQDYSLSIPTYKSIISDSDDYNIDCKNKRIVNNKTNTCIDDLNKIKEILFSKFWFDNANIFKYNYSDFIYSSEVEEFYYKLFELIRYSIDTKGYIDTVKIFNYFRNSKYSFAPLIVVNLFDNLDKIEFIYEYFTNVRANFEHEILYDLEYAYNFDDSFRL